MYRSIQQFSAFVDEYRDPRTRDWPFSRDLSLQLGITSIYLLTVSKFGLEFMAKRKAFNLKTVLFWYNLLQIILNAWLFLRVLKAGWLGQYNLLCQPVDYSSTPEAIEMANVVWWFLVLKDLDLLDTIFFVLRKKYSQITYLHLFHHSVMPSYMWVGVNFFPGGHGTLIVVLNTFVHVVMYSYYLLASMGPEFQKALWWKKHLTRLQLIQFASVILHMIPVLLVPECKYPKGVAALALYGAALFAVLFGNFYAQEYTTKRENNKHKQ